MRLRLPHERILDAMVWLESGRVPMPWHQSLVAYAALFRPRTGSLKRELAVLSERGLITQTPGGLVLEEGGRELAEAPAKPFTRTAYHARLDRKLDKVERLVVRSIRMADEGIGWDDLASRLPAWVTEAELRDRLARLVRSGVIVSEHETKAHQRTVVLHPLDAFEIRAAAAATSGRQRPPT
jgi:hypothetical protein